MKTNLSMTYNIITLKNGDFIAKINASRGANLISLRNDRVGAKILREPDYSKPLDNPYLYGAPILFPVNRIFGGSFTFEGRKYRFPINEPSTNCHLHGFLHQAEFKVLKVTNRSAILNYISNEEDEYFGGVNKFSITITYKLTKSGIKIKTTVENLSNANMPVMLGYHTTFNSRFINNASPKVKVGFDTEIERDMTNYLPNGNYPEFDEISLSVLNGEFNPLSRPISKHYRCKNLDKIVIFDENSNYSVKYNNSKSLAYRLIYNGNADEYICLEPQTVMANAPNVSFNKEVSGFDYIKPNFKKVFKSEILLLKGDRR